MSSLNKPAIWFILSQMNPIQIGLSVTPDIPRYILNARPYIKIFRHAGFTLKPAFDWGSDLGEVRGEAEKKGFYNRFIVLYEVGYGAVLLCVLK